MLLTLFLLALLAIFIIGMAATLWLVVKALQWLFGQYSRPVLRAHLPAASTPLALPDKPAWRPSDARFVHLDMYAKKDEAPAPIHDPQRIRKAIAKLHADAQAPAPPEEARGAAAPAKAPQPLDAVTTNHTGKNAGVPARPALPRKTLAERLFTPENVRILQSLGIGIIFVSAAAFVRMQMWSGASPWQQLGILALGTVACAGLGLALRRWTELRITGLAFLVLGQLSIVLDAYAALVPPALYPYSAASLWTLALFTASAFWQARAFKEPLFDAFTWFGGLAAWGAALLWLDLDPWLLPAGCVPAVLASIILGAWLRSRAQAVGCAEGKGCRGEAGCLTHFGWRRWTLGWWLDSGGQAGAFVLTAALPLAALFSGQTRLAAHLDWHLAALLALAGTLLTEGLRRRAPWQVHAGTLLLLTLTPVAGWGLGWPLAEAPLQLALPGAALVLASLAVRRTLLYAGSARQALAEYLLLPAWWGLGAVLISALWAAEIHIKGAGTLALAAGCAAAQIITALSLACLLESARERKYLIEFAALALIAVAGINVAWAYGVTGLSWTLALALISATVLAAANAAAVWHGADGPSWRETGAGLAVALSYGAAFLLMFMSDDSKTDAAMLLYATWITALTPLGVAVLAQRQSAADSGRQPVGVASLLGAGLALVCFLLAGVQALQAEFWLPAPGCSDAMRQACAAFFAATLVLSAALGWFARMSLAAPAATLAALGLIGCAYGAWDLPKESFGLLCAGLALAVLSVSSLYAKARGLARLPLSCLLAAGLAAVIGAGHQAVGLFIWPAGAGHAFAVLAWAAFAGMSWFIASRDDSETQGTRAVPALGMALAGLCSVLAACQAQRWLGLDLNQCGPGVAAAALLLLGLRQLLPRGSLWHGLTVSVALTALAGLALGAVGWLDGHLASWSATLGLTALLAGALSLSVRREHVSPPVSAGSAAQHAPAGALVLELAAWALSAAALSAGAAAAEYGWLLQGPGWALAGALVFLIGMALESTAGGLLSLEQRRASPGAFLESRHIVGLSLAFFAVLSALAAQRPLAAPGIEMTWSAVLSAAFVAAYASMAAWSYDAHVQRVARTLSAFAAYIVLLPLGYLCLLHAHSTGSPWGALWFLALAPVLLVAAGLLQREGCGTQANMARCGALFVACGALMLAFVKNPLALPEVPLVTFAALGVLALGARRFAPAAWRPAYSLAACTALTGAAYYGVRALAGDPAWGAHEPSVWEWPALAGLGLALTALGGAGKLEAGARGRSLVAQYGSTLSALALGVALLSLLVNGTQADYLRFTNHARLEAFIVALLCVSATFLAAKQWLELDAGEYLAGAGTLLGYVLFCSTMRPEAWEWYTLPLALFCFAWAKAKAGEPRESPGETNLALSFGSVLALAPSFLQALAYDRAALGHYYMLVGLGLALVAVAMLARRKVPLLTGSGAVLLLTAIKTAQWAAHKEAIGPVLGIGFGFAVLAVGCLFESRMNRTLRAAVDRARAEARMFWVSWE